MRSDEYDRLYLSPPHLGRHELNYVHKAIEDNWVAPAGPNIDGFERDLNQYVGTQHCVALSSGTAAIHLGLQLLGVGPGDEVLVPSFTFVATANPVCYLGAQPVFIDSEANTWNLCPMRLREALEERARRGKQAKAIIIVHLYGMPALLPELLEIAAEYGVPVLEDAAEALGSRHRGQALGSFGQVAVLSFNGNKIITTSGGGALLTNNGEYARQARWLSTQAKDPAPYYQHSAVGYNYRLSNILAGIGRGQMELIEERVKRRREIYALYHELMRDLPAVEVGPTEPAGTRSNRWLTTILLRPEHTERTPEELRQHLETHNIESRPLWKPLHLQPLFTSAAVYGGQVCADLFTRGLCLPSGSSMTDTDVRRVVKALQEML
ncbi:aminotransferase class I/II-fold pyridoxal phosphate-dependent enzyme [Hymenobacter busanensis]|uniref:Aminotransferase class I/II-fold pyridoxal phosphate-dependent enzyme n=1 Tax=Hymenobacter busanensis TaxID=2607656 RepID=A0A7L4ZWS1_9BACT|nr:aminotransferase class I/II-fold pyridoxal phosphate-dependent enzyme [Hymenobacter busanensis]KAA9332195.1 aminotransferase class I/II-fold pyridoxal phosphate-dependent enzyme [Hymenobacter busanensis]QHJ07467.1 aminotransferase class I/II-fold pyridoxal phosphate-dependent enzyme [Hymenobacter busanensis]